MHFIKFYVASKPLTDQINIFIHLIEDINTNKKELNIISIRALLAVADDIAGHICGNSKFNTIQELIETNEGFYKATRMHDSLNFKFRPQDIWDTLLKD